MSCNIMTKENTVSTIPMLPGQFCGHCGSYGEADRFDLGPKFPDAGLDDHSDNYELLIQCPACRWWTIWIFDNDEFEKHQEKTGGEGWPKPKRILTVDDDHWDTAHESSYHVVLYDRS